jgi:alginate O-acetyltransferase complex protein AlgI
MLFNSFVFIFIFMPIVLILYYLIGRIHIPFAKAWLLVASLFFYAYWNSAYLPLILISMVVNFLLGSYLGRNAYPNLRKTILAIGIIFNVGLLSYYKYLDFFIDNVNGLFDTNLPLQQILLPLAISFYTFTQIAYLVDSYRMETKEYNLLNYGLFVSFFPHLIAGPIVYHKQLAPQFNEKQTYHINYKNISIGIVIFTIGLFKKVVIADSFAVWATEGYKHADILSLIEAWIVSLSYTFQLYFDFSGYTDMAIGIALMFNVILPINFNSPYKATNITEFWSSWHITLTRFLASYIYIPLGGNRKGQVITYINVMILFLISGFWHGAGWTFIFWGLLHGLASVIHRYWKKLKFKMNSILAWLITFNFVNLSWVFFRAETWSDAINMLRGMFGIHGIHVPNYSMFISMQDHFDLVLTNYFIDQNQFIYATLLILASFIIVLFFKNTDQLSKSIKFNWLSAFFVAILITVTIYFAFTSFHNSEFIYFNF